MHVLPEPLWRAVCETNHNIINVLVEIKKERKKEKKERAILAITVWFLRTEWSMIDSEINTDDATSIM